MALLEPGKSAPLFTLPDQSGEKVALKSLRGEPVVLYFYPRADTPGCTVQACGIRDHRAELKRAGVTVLGVSPDPVEAVAKFDSKHSLDFTLLADEDHKVAEKYGVWVEKSMYGKKYWGVQRATYVIDSKGKIAHVIEKASPKTHAEDILGLVAETS
jgi:peroxiredoxin Q/BCP